MTGFNAMTGSGPVMRLAHAVCAAAFILIAGAPLQQARADDDADAVVRSYADLGQAVFEDALSSAKTLDSAVGALIEKPSPETLAAARAAWIAARKPYQQSEAFRFGNPVVDDWEGRVNSWPLDEGLIDYVDPRYGGQSGDNALFTANVIANRSIEINGAKVDASPITPQFLSGTLHEAGGIEANVATGYHAVEFMLWGQDLNGTKPGAGARPYTDFDPANCTGGNCERRAQYLAAVTSLLVSDLAEMAADWQPGGKARAVLEQGAKPGLATILTGLGSLSYGELAGERMKLGLLLHDPEEEQDCFSDNTHNSHLNDVIGIRNVYFGSYERIDGSKVSGPSLSGLVREADPALDDEMRGKLDVTLAAVEAIAAGAQAGTAYDQLIAEGNDRGNAMVQAAIDALIDQTSTIQKIVTALGVDGASIEGSQSLENTGAVFE
jgi:putative iron-regulated protein